MDTDTNQEIHDYRIRSSIKPDIKHIPKTLIGALAETDKHMKKDKATEISSDMIARRSFLSRKSKPVSYHQQPPTKIAGLADFNPLATSPNGKAVKKKDNHKASSMSCSVLAMMVQVILFVITIGVIIAAVIWMKNKQ